MTLIKRIDKGSKLTWAELDGNFDHLVGLYNAISNRQALLSGSDAPSNSIGQDGDYYIDSLNNKLHGPKSTTWPAGIDMTAQGLDVKAATTIWVSPTGNDSTGTRGKIGLPFATLSAATTAATSGDTIIVRSGSYTGQGHWQISSKTLFVKFDPGVTLLGIKAISNGKIYFEGRPNFINNLNSSIDTEGSDSNSTFLTKGSGAMINGICGNITNNGTAYFGSSDTGSKLILKAIDIVSTSNQVYGFRCRGDNTIHTVQDISFEQMYASSTFAAFILTCPNPSTTPKSYVRITGTKLVALTRCYFNQYGGNNSISEQVIDVNVSYSQSLSMHVVSGGANNTDTTNKYQYVKVTSGVLISELDDTIVLGDKVNSNRRMIGLYATGCTIVNRRNVSGAVAIFLANNLANDTYCRLQGCSLISKGTYTVNAQSASAANFFNHGGNSYNKATNNTTIIGPAITAVAGYIEHPLEIPNY